MARFEKRAKRCPIDLTDEEWLFIRPFLPAVSERGRKPGTDRRDVLDALRYLTRTSGGWRMLPNDFPPWQTVYWWFRRFVRRLLFRAIHDVTLMLDRDRDREGREHSPATADVSDGAGAQHIVAAIRKRWPWLKHLFADGAYNRTRLMDAAAYRTFVLAISMPGLELHRESQVTARRVEGLAMPFGRCPLKELPKILRNI